MKKLSLSILLTAIIIFTHSCIATTKNYYQFYKIKPISNITVNQTKLVYEDENCKVAFDFWGNKGDPGYWFYNKSETQNIYINKKECFFILNGVAYDYYKNRTMSVASSNNTSSSVALGNSNSLKSVVLSEISGHSNTLTYGSVYIYKDSYYDTKGISLLEQDIICVPPKCSKRISEYYINDILYRDCNLFIKPSKDKIVTSEFSQNNSPIVFSNIITYLLEGDNNVKKIEPSFYVSSISNYPRSYVTEKKEYTNLCEDDKKAVSSYSKETRRFKPEFVSPDLFFITYSPDNHNSTVDLTIKLKH